MPKYKIIFDREGCIGALACAAVNPKRWIISSDGKVDMKEAKKRPDGKFELIIDSKEILMAKDEVAVCPVNVINIEEVE